MARQLRVAGHTLPFEGRVMVAGWYRNGPGFGRCSCGARSEKELPNTAARQRWHRAHKEEIAGGGGH
jgi:hypothetical protein